MKSYIGIDWGEGKIGTAFGNDENCIAFAAETFENDYKHGRKPKIFDQLIALAHEYDACIFIIGIAQHSGHRDNVQAVEEFAQAIEQRSAVKIVFADEMLTTKQAQENLKATGKKNITKNDDAESARMILQSYLDRYCQV